MLLQQLPTPPSEWIHIGIGIGTLVASIIATYVSLTNKNVTLSMKINQEQNKAELLKNQNDVQTALIRDAASVKESLIANQVRIKEELTERQSEQQIELRSHIAQDDERFSGISKTLTRIDANVTVLGSTVTGLVAEVRSNGRRHAT